MGTLQREALPAPVQLPGHGYIHPPGDLLADWLNKSGANRPDTALQMPGKAAVLLGFDDFSRIGFAKFIMQRTGSSAHFSGWQVPWEW
jgi:hypothetical protein